MPYPKIANPKQNKQKKLSIEAPAFGTMSKPSHNVIITPPRTRLTGGNILCHSVTLENRIPAVVKSSEHKEKLMSIVISEQKSSAAAPLAALKRPLSAYNVYFQLERKRLVNGDPKRTYAMDDAIALCDEQRIIRSKPKPKRLHRKTHGVVTFQQMARTIADSWKVLDNGQKQLFEDCAASEKKRYLKEKHILKVKAAEDAAAIASGVEMKPSQVSSDNILISEEEEIADSKEKDAAQITPENSNTKPNSNENTFHCVSKKEQHQGVRNDDYLQRMMNTSENHLEFEGKQEQADGGDDGINETFYRTHQNLMYKLMLVHERQAKLRHMEQSIRFMIQQQRRMMMNKRKSLDNSSSSIDNASNRARNLNRRHSMSTFPLLQMMRNNNSRSTSSNSSSSSSSNTGGAYNLFNSTRSPSSVNFASHFFDMDANENNGTNHLDGNSGVMDDMNNASYDVADDMFS